jgi:uncharacterized protein (DUF2062 family)
VNLLSRIKRFLPTPTDVHEYRYIHIFGDTLKQAELWAFNRVSVSKGIAVGIFCAFLPMPFEMVAAIFIAAMIGAHIPFAIAGIWISNPLTWIPLYTPCYLLGAWLIGVEPVPLEDISISVLGWHYVALWLGCLILGSLISISSHFIVNALWKANILRRWQRRRSLRSSNSQEN